MRNLSLFCASLLVALPFTGLASTLSEIDMARGQTDENRIDARICDTATVSPLAIGTIAATYDRQAKIVRGSFIGGPTYSLDPKVDLGKLLENSLRSEAKAMGFAAASPAPVEGAEIWRISGTLTEFYLESHQLGIYTPIIFYSFVQVELDVAHGNDAPRHLHLRIPEMTLRYSLGFSRKDKTEAAIARTIVSASQEILARLNHDFIHAPAVAGMDERLAQLVKSGAEAHEHDLRLISLSGLPAATPALLKLLSAEKDENNRIWIINGLAVLGSADAASPLATAYARESDENARYYSLKAMAYLGTDPAMKLLREAGPKDRDAHARKLANWLIAP